MMWNECDTYALRNFPFLPGHLGSDNGGYTDKNYNYNIMTITTSVK